MQLKNIQLLIVTLLTVLGCAGIPQHSETPIVSVEELVAHPSKYLNKRIGVSGFYKLAFEESGLYRTEHEAQFGTAREAVWIWRPDQEALDRELGASASCYVTVFGVPDWHPDSVGYWQPFPVILRKVDSIIRTQADPSAVR